VEHLPFFNPEVFDPKTLTSILGLHQNHQCFQSENTNTVVITPILSLIFLSLIDTCITDKIPSLHLLGIDILRKDQKMLCIKKKKKHDATPPLEVMRDQQRGVVLLHRAHFDQHPHQLPPQHQRSLHQSLGHASPDPQLEAAH
jgi:hypothetical protein